eukprot:1221019-Alexandrium_andersonii.AAC.1
MPGTDGVSVQLQPRANLSRPHVAAPRAGEPTSFVSGRLVVSRLAAASEGSDEWFRSSDAQEAAG